MSIKKSPWLALLALLIGFGIGLSYTWIIAPVKYVDASPYTLREDFKDKFRTAIAAAYASNLDIERARARLSLLGDDDSSQSLTAQAQRMVAEGESATAIQQVAMLASALQGQTTVPNSSTVTSLPETNQPPASQVVEVIPSPAISLEPTTVDVETTPQAILTPTPRPSRTPTQTLGAPFQLLSQDTVCDRSLEEGLLQITVSTITRKQIPGAEIIVSWNNGEEHIFTGFKPELGNGYADFVMTPNVTYTVRMADGGTAALEISSPECTNSDGDPYSGGVSINFQRP